MTTCPACSREVSDGSRFCSSCGAAIETPTSAPTETSLKSQPGTSHPTPDQVRFIPGAILAKRYRIVGLLGRGGMGEVYRADDLKLGQSVALKFLPQAVQRDQTRLDRFLNEVKTALKVTHPNVCRVHDIGEVDGQHYLSMEYVDGEDLASLLRRIERLPQNKAVQIARQLCAGLAAAHNQGILHRDLKPANVMIDGRGQAKITDFGLAGLAKGIEGDEIRAGTPQYMSPEQHAGKEVTVSSDIYSLGLVLYELFTGKRAFEGKTPAEIAKLQAESIPSSPSHHVEGLDPAVERIVLRCIEREPTQRPSSALAVASALPGGDPLAAALAAGETPSPDLVAGAGGDGGLKPTVAVPLLVLVLGALVLTAHVVDIAGLVGMVQPDKPPEVLIDRAQAILEDVGYPEPPADFAYGFGPYAEYLDHLEQSDASLDRWKGLATGRPSALAFWYRQSPRPLVSKLEGGTVSQLDPQQIYSGMASVVLYDDGSLWVLKVVPPQYRESGGPAPAPDWMPLFEAAELDPDELVEVSPRWISESYCNTRAAWTGTYPGQSEPEIRVEACAYDGKPVYFDIIHPWDKPWRSEAPTSTASRKATTLIWNFLWVLILVAGILLARRNLKLGRGDRRGAFRVAGFVFLMAMLSWLFLADHVWSAGDEVPLLFREASFAFFDAGLVWLVYIALEPFVRRRWPEALISWNRVLAGRFRDPLVGRDLLLGAAIGLALGSWLGLMHFAPEFLGLPRPQPPSLFGLGDLRGTHWLLGGLFNKLRGAVYGPMALLFLLVLARIVLRRQWLAVVVMAAIIAVTNSLGSEYVWFDFVANFVLFGTAMVCAVRFGILVLVVGNLYGGKMLANTLTLDLSAWYAGGSLTVLALAAALAIYGFYISLGGRPLLAGRAHEGT